MERFPRRWIDSRPLDIIIQDIPPPLFYPFDTVHLVAVSSDVIVIFNLITTTSERRREIDSPLCNSHSYSADFSVLTHLISSHSHTIHPPRNLPPLRRDTSNQRYNQTRRLGTRVQSGPDLYSNPILHRPSPLYSALITIVILIIIGRPQLGKPYSNLSYLLKPYSTPTHSTTLLAYPTVPTLHSIPESDIKHHRPFTSTDRHQTNIVITHTYT